MKIALLNLPIDNNYGGNLQRYALITVLQHLGHEVDFIRISIPYQLPILKAPFVYTKRLIKKIVRKENCILFLENRLNKEQPIISQHINKFIETYIPSTKEYKSKDSLKELEEQKYDAYIVGSDQVWRAAYAKPIEKYFFDFLGNSNAKRIAYAVSFGTENDEYTKYQKKRCGRLIEKFNAISVRELSGIDLIKKYNWHCKEQPVCLLDPTMLLKPADYIKLSEGYNTHKNKGSLFYYILDMTPEKETLIETLANKKKIKPFTVFPENINAECSIEKRIHPPIEQWLKGFIDAEYIVTDSYHGCVFSILFNKPFIVYGNEKRGMARFKSLLRIFNLEYCLVSSNNKTSDCDKIDQINWNDVNNILKVEREKSLSFLSNI